MTRGRRSWLAAGLGVGLVGAAAAFWLTRADPGDPRLGAFVRARPPVAPAALSA